MKTLLVPVDFTATSENAVNFAAEWSKRYGYERIILLKTFYDSVFENIAVSAGYANFDQACLNKERENAVAQLQQLCKHLTSKTDPTVKVITATSEMPLLRAIVELIEDEKPELIILGSDNYRYSSDSYVAGHVISIAKASSVRVLIVPSDCSYQPVAKALVPCDLNAITNVDRINYVRTAPQWQDITLEVLVVDPAEQHLNPDSKSSEHENSLHDYLKNFKHQLHYSKEKNVIMGIKSFISEHDVQLIIALPCKHSFLYNFTHKSISEAIYRNSSKPVLVLK